MITCFMREFYSHGFIWIQAQGALNLVSLFRIDTRLVSDLKSCSPFVSPFPWLGRFGGSFGRRPFSLLGLTLEHLHW